MTGAKLIVSSRYLKSGTAKNTVKRKNYTRYIATRETVELREQQKISVDGEVTDRQRELLAELFSDFPEAKTYLEYQDYAANPTGQNASELIGTIMERNADLIGSKKSLVGYMAMRPGAERRGEHGLFNGSDDPIVLNQAADEVAHHKGNVWSHVVSLRREDAVRLGYDNSDRWRELVKRHISDLAAAHKIPLSHLKWYAAFHDTTHHPHIHLLVYSTDLGEGFLSKKGIESIRSVFANDIFHDDLQSIYQEQTASRDRIRAVSAEEFSEMVRQIQRCQFQNPQLEMLIRRLREQLKNAKGKKVYGYLPKAVKQTVDKIFTQLAGDKQIKSLYSEWCELEKLKYQSYTMQEPNLPDLQDNKVFKPVKNMIIRTVMQMENQLDVAEPELFPSANEQVRSAVKMLDGENVDKGIQMLAELANKGDASAAYHLGKLYAEGLLVYADIPKAEKYLTQAAEAGSVYAQYALAKLYMTEEKREVARVITLLEQCADGNPWAAFRLGKLLLFGTDEVAADKELAMLWLKKAAEGGIEIARQIVQNVEQLENQMMAETIFGLFVNLSRTLENDYSDKANKLSQTDSKLRAMLRRKKQELGIKDEPTQGQSY